MRNYPLGKRKVYSSPLTPQGVVFGNYAADNVYAGFYGAKYKVVGIRI